ncbi:hypothetical protein B0T19DRAFT_476390 [Cercophora scortea]|uniref:Fungal N-terminal domain-containing protein n=1 Tax=Cercophora scortea TaxID=314031 RepID=A0AAE0M8C6_9PEZI|nr:hypothetical protein B0T19DRAFT_476390 [Cercophora scortea]
MDGVSCGVAALAVGKLCLATVRGLQTVFEKYRNAPQTVAALHTEVVAIGASMHYIQLILAKNPELETSRFYGDGDLAQLFLHALSGCRLVMISLQQQVSSLVGDMGQQGSTARKAKRRFLWKESSIKELLQTVRAQQAAISSIIQCLQVENTTALAARMDGLQVVLSEKHRVPQEHKANPGLRLKRKAVPRSFVSRQEPGENKRGSVISDISAVSSLTRQWLESQLSPEETARTFSRIRAVAKSVTSDQEDSFSLHAPDTESFLENIQYFMPRHCDASLDLDPYYTLRDNGATERLESDSRDGDDGTGSDSTPVGSTCSWSKLEETDTDSIRTGAECSETFPAGPSNASSETLVTSSPGAGVTTKGLAQPIKEVSEVATSSFFLPSPDKQANSQEPTSIHHPSSVSTTSNHNSEVQGANPSVLPCSHPPLGESSDQNNTTSRGQRLPTISPLYTGRCGKDALATVMNHPFILRKSYPVSHAPAISGDATAEEDPLVGSEGKTVTRRLPPILTHAMYDYIR